MLKHVATDKNQKIRWYLNGHKLTCLPTALHLKREEAFGFALAAH
jgi:hypothetical protein